MKTSLPERSEHVAEKLTAITDIIRELLDDDLVMLILFGSYARGDWVQDKYVEDGITYTYESDFDLLVVTERRATFKREAGISGSIGRWLRREGLDRPSATIIVEDIAHFMKDLQRGNYFYVDIKKEGVLLFDNGQYTLPEVGPIDPVENQEYARDDFEHWYKSACEFSDNYQFNLEQVRYNNAAFQLHQATERFFNAVALTFTRYKPKTHDIEYLDRLASNLHPDFFTVFPRATPEQEHYFDLLKKAYIDARYKRDYAITKEELEYLAGRVRKLQELTKRICEEKIASLA